MTYAKLQRPKGHAHEGRGCDPDQEAALAKQGLSTNFRGCGGRSLEACAIGVPVPVPSANLSSGASDRYGGSAAFKKAICQHVPHARVVFDRFHVQRLVHDALDQLRRSMVADLRDPDETRTLKGSRYALQHSPKLGAAARGKLRELEQDNQPLYRAYLMKEALAAIFDMATPESIHGDLMNRLAWVDADGAMLLLCCGGITLPWPHVLPL